MTRACLREELPNYWAIVKWLVFLCARCREYLFTVMDSNVFVYTRGQQRACLHSWAATCLFTFMDSNALLQNSNFYITDINYYIDYAVTENVNHNDDIHTKHKLKSTADYRLWGRLLCRRSWFIFPFILAAVSKCFHINFPSLLLAAIAATIKANGFVSHNYSPYVCLHSQLP